MAQTVFDKKAKVAELDIAKREATQKVGAAKFAYFVACPGHDQAEFLRRAKAAGVALAAPPAEVDADMDAGEQEVGAGEGPSARSNPEGSQHEPGRASAAARSTHDLSGEAPAPPSKRQHFIQEEFDAEKHNIVNDGNGHHGAEEVPMVARVEVQLL